MIEELITGRVAKLAAVNVETILYYQRRGLLDEPVKPIWTYRHYPTATVEHIHSSVRPLCFTPLLVERRL